MAHGAVDVDRLADLEDHRVIERGVYRDRALEDVYIFLARVLHQLAELRETFGADAANDRNHALTPQLRTHVVVVVVLGRDTHGIREKPDAAPRGNRGIHTRGSGCWIGEQLRQRYLETLAHLQELVIGQGQAIALHL